MSKHHHTCGARKCKAVGMVGKEEEPNARRRRGIFGAGMTEPKEENKQLHHHFRLPGSHQQCPNGHGVLSAAHTKSSYHFTGLLCWDSGGTNTTSKGQKKWGKDPAT